MPVLLTIATEGDEDVHVTVDVRFCVVPSAKVPSAVKLVDICWGTEGLDGRMLIDFKADDPTKKLAALLIPPRDTVMTAVPADCPVTRP
jgi:hypothetical protein